MIEKTKRSKAAEKALLASVRSTAAQYDGSLQRLQEEHAALQRKYSNALAVLEAVVRRHGPQTFDRSMVQTICAAGRVHWDVTPERITLLLNVTGEVPLTDAKVT